MRRDLTKLFLEHENVQQVVQAAVREALFVHKRLGNLIAVWRDEGVAWIPAEEIDLGPAGEPAH